MNKMYMGIVLYFFILLFSGCNTQKDKNQGPTDDLLYNQVSYIVDAPAMVLVAPDVSIIKVYDEKGQHVTDVSPEESMYWKESGDHVRKAYISGISEPGVYTLQLPEKEKEFTITVSNHAYDTLSRSAIEALYINRVSMDIEEEFAGKWARPAGHPDTVVYVHSSASEPHRPEGTVLSSPGGWYDAGDFNKYIVNSGISTYTMFKALTDYPEFFNGLTVDIPEKNNTLPDILDETLYNYQWMLTMQDPQDGGVYHKLTHKNFQGIMMPHEASADRYVVMKSTAAALNLAAVAAKAYRVLSNYEKELPGLARESLEKAELAWQWAVTNPEVYYKQPDDIQTGMYGDGHLDDEFFWAAAELYRSTGESKYLETILEKYSKPNVPTWNQVYALGFLTLLEDYESLPTELQDKGIREDFLELTSQLTRISQESPYGVSIQLLEWGSNSAVANEGILKLAAYNLTGNKDHLHSALSDLDYLLGRNATGYCFVTGFGDQQVMNIHHRQSEADDVEEPVPGFLVGGPNTSTFEDCPDMERSKYPAKSYVDHWCSYSTNEVTINWNAPLVYLSGALHHHLKSNTE